MKQIIKNAEQALNIKPPKTIDPLYTEAKESFIKISKDTIIMIKSINNFLNDLERISRLSVRIGDGVASFFNDNPQYQPQGRNLSTVGQNVDRLTYQFLKPKLDPYVVQPLESFQAEIKRLKDVRSKLKVERKNYDRLRQKLQKLEGKNSNLNLVRETEGHMREAYNKYQSFNQDFIQSVKKLVASRPQCLDTPLTNMTNILSQYLGEVMKNVNSLRTTFPPQVFVQKYGPSQEVTSNPYSQAPLPDLGPNPYSQVDLPPSQPQMPAYPMPQQAMQQPPMGPPQAGYPSVPQFIPPSMENLAPPPPVPVIVNGQADAPQKTAKKKSEPMAC
ncbi:hypothetical protein TRFO_05188 [Tritrichomonas foetus]|uniref:BAR domain-containing protein n=1 Tax=Tritrichomonas foetus TaxID=1144522 RepID=A0A1J4K9E0_9EUKA|nr:hypothetical protein TRFO_05188 [Tritrichomonas foetus]|eukprot:OHT07554.1 hypothetical protein TRFO_05188 [Tritrichomonas foetus]